MIRVGSGADALDSSRPYNQSRSSWRLGDIPRSVPGSGVAHQAKKQVRWMFADACGGSSASRADGRKGRDLPAGGAGESLPSAWLEAQEAVARTY
jgi:hypothetical protein